MLSPGGATSRRFRRGCILRRCIVIADDDPGVVSLVALRLGLARFNVVQASDGEQALALVRKHQPMAVVLDVQMPRMSGLDVLGELKGDPLTSNLPVIMLTGERNNETVMQAMGCGADDYMVKPFDPDTLLERVNRLVRTSTMVWPAAQKKTAPVWEL
jgi:DNA-binding response OmpR family regulator